MTITSSQLLRSARVVLRCVLTAVAVAGGAVVIWTLGPGAGWVLRHVDHARGLTGKDLEDAVDAVRGRALAVGTGLAALVAVYYTAHNADTARKTLAHGEESSRRTAELTEQGQVTERYTKAIEQLGSDKLDIRIGGIYALERVAADSARDHPTVMEVLSTFIREHAPAPAIPTGEPPPSPSAWPSADVQAALTVIARRTPQHDTRQLDLSRAYLNDARLTGADLTGADLTGAHLTGAHLTGAHLNEANLTGANLTGANLTDAHLTGANLTDAHLTHANVNGAHLASANLFFADLSGADLIEANLTGANLSCADLTAASLHRAHLNEAELTGANLYGTHLAGAYLRSANLTDVVGIDPEEILAVATTDASTRFGTH